MHTVIQAALSGTSMVARYKNVYCSIEGMLHPTPFEMPREGMWYFDGQVFYQRHAPNGGL